MAVWQKSQGITLLEVMLVIAIGAAILFLSIQQYLSYRRDADVTQVKANVDILFQSLSYYFRANCKSQDFAREVSTAGIPVRLDQLQKGGYLTQSLPLSPILNNSDPNKTYIMQFNQYTENGALPSRTMQNYLGTNTNIGSIVIYQAQVAANLLNANTTTQYQNLLAADCLSTSGSNNTVRPCASATPGSYAVWSRAPSVATGTMSPYWQTIPTIKQFTQMYTTYEILVLMDQTKTGTQYYVCGS